ncbi:MAG: hypothetical protein KGJ80_15645 [Chloroflexota bacterium]|nr:hypothetical protein [Chloroflexota bacterium]
MAKKKSKGTPPNQTDILNQLSADDALAVLRILAHDEAIAARMHQVAETYLEGNAPHAPEDVEEIAEDVRAELEGLEVEEVWDRAGQTRHGYVEEGEVADEMIRRVLNPCLEDLTRYQRLGMAHEAMYLCMGLMQGLYEFQHQSESEFKDWATDLPIAYAEIALEKWRAGKPTPSAIKEMQTFIQENLPHWDFTLMRALPKGK